MEKPIYHQNFYFDYRDFNNPRWVLKVFDNHRKIQKLLWAKTAWFGIFKIKRLNSIIDKLRNQNRTILLKYNPDMASYRLGSWRDGRRQLVQVLEIFPENKKEDPFVCEKCLVSNGDRNCNKMDCLYGEEEQMI